MYVEGMVVLGDKAVRQKVIPVLNEGVTA